MISLGSTGFYLSECMERKKIESSYEFFHQKPAFVRYFLRESVTSLNGQSWYFPVLELGMGLAVIGGLGSLTIRRKNN